MTKGGFRRKFICKKCKKESYDQAPDKVKTKVYGDIEFENVDLCNICFPQEIKRQRQNYIILDMYQRGKVTMQEVEKLNVLGKLEDKIEFEKFRGELLRRNEMKKGDMRNKKLEKINLMLAEQEYYNLTDGKK